jgi:hypothetical protein
LIRSYDNEKEDGPKVGRSDTASSHKDLENKKYGKADPLEIWEVARAATAAPMYFEAIKFQNQTRNGTTETWFSDGGFSQANNPTKEGVAEIEMLHGKENIGLIVSIGTARGPSEPRGKGIVSFIKTTVDQHTNPEVPHNDLEKQFGENQYIRFNDLRGVGVVLDDWRPNGFFTKHPGKKTLKEIRHGFHKWSSDRSVNQQIQKCAELLVARRRLRIQDNCRWQRYATVAYFPCHCKGCPAPAFHNAEEFEKHLLDDHSCSSDEAKELVGKKKVVFTYQSRAPTT